VKELIERISISEDGEVLLRLTSGGRPSYQYVYRAARGVYWDSTRQGFTFSAGSDEPNRWIEHICKVVEEELGIQLILPVRPTV
jgi:hypothetical protein